MGFYLVPYCQPSPAMRFLLITAIGMCLFRRLWNGMFGQVEGQYTTQTGKSPSNTPTNVLDMILNKAPEIQELWKMQSSPSLPSLPGPLWPGVVVPEKVLSMGQIEILTLKLNANKWLMLNWIVINRTVWSFNCVLTNDWFLIELLVIHSNTWNLLTLLTYVYKSYICINWIWH